MRRLLITGLAIVAVVVVVAAATLGGSNGHHSRSITIRSLGTHVYRAGVIATGEWVRCRPTGAAARLPSAGNGVNSSMGITLVHLTDGRVRATCSPRSTM